MTRTQGRTATWPDRFIAVTARARRHLARRFLLFFALRASSPALRRSLSPESVIRDLRRDGCAPRKFNRDHPDTSKFIDGIKESDGSVPMAMERRERL